jgi:hypothetical protein
MSTQFIRLVKNDKSLLRFKLKCTPNRYNSPEGEVDIIVDSANKKIPFEYACIQTDRGRLFTNELTDSVSWHGFYSKENDEIKLPVINFKSGDKKTTYRHTGTVNQADIFLFPICSAYIQSNIDLKLFSGVVRNENTEIINLSSNLNVRVDFFVLPKSITVQEFMSNYSHSVYYCIADISIFNKNLNGIFQNLPVKKNGGY